MMRMRKRTSNRFDPASLISALAVTFCSICCTASTLADDTDKRYLIVRYDDYAPVTHYQREHSDTTIERRLFQIFERQGAKIVAAVVPFPIDDQSIHVTDPTFANAEQSWLSDEGNPWVLLLRDYVERGVVEPALHGFEHRRVPETHYRHGEFRRRSFDWQRKALKLGRDVLSDAVDARITVFVPPWNAWDADTARALSELDFEWLSPDLHHADYELSKLRVVPQITADPRSILTWVQRGDDVPAGSIAVLVTCPVDFEGDDGESYFLDLLELLAMVRASPHWRCVGFNDLPEETPQNWDARFRLAVSHDRARSVLNDTAALPPVAKLAPTLYMPTDSYEQPVKAARFGVSAVMAISALLGVLAARLGCRYVLQRKRWAVSIALVVGLIGLIVLVIGAVGIAAEGYRIRGIRWQAICCAIGFTMGLLVARGSLKSATD